jgi:hypothetical protein
MSTDHGAGVDGWVEGAQQRADQVAAFVHGSQGNGLRCLDPCLVVGAHEGQPITRQKLHIEDVPVELGRGHQVGIGKPADPHNVGHGGPTG